MESTIQSTLLVMLYVEVTIGCFGNGFIASVYCVDWIKKRKISMVGQIVTALAFCRISLLLTMLTELSVSVSKSDMATIRNMAKMMNFHLLFSNHFNMWLAACLSLFYFLKIGNFSNCVFFYFKRRANQVVSGTLLASLALLILSVVLMNSSIDAIINGYKGHLLYDFTCNNTAEFFQFLLVFQGIFISTPFILSQSTLLLLIVSLWRHHKKMQQHAQRSRDALTNAHIRALQTMIIFVLLGTIFFLALFMHIWRHDMFDNILHVRFYQLIAATFPSGHSFVLIWGDTKLRQASLCVLWWLRCKFKDVQHMSP